jgi:hypothetical protein
VIQKKGVIFIPKKQISIRLSDDIFNKLDFIRKYYISKSAINVSFNSVLEKVLKFGIEGEIMQIESEKRIIARGKIAIAKDDYNKKV